MPRRHRAEIRERYLVIVALERLCATEAFARDVDGLVESLRARLAEQRAGTATPADEDMYDRAFHAALWDAGGLPSVVSMLRMLWDRGGYYRSLLFAHGDFAMGALAEHAAILSGRRGAGSSTVFARWRSTGRTAWRGCWRSSRAFRSEPRS